MLAAYTGNIPNRLTGAETFSTDTDYFHSYFTPFIAQFNADIAALNLNSVQDSSSTSNTIGTGVKTFTVGIGKSFQAGQYLIFADALAPTTNSMVVQVQDYNSATGVMNVLAIVFTGSGTKTSWIISLTAMPIYGTAGRTFLDVKQLQSIDYSFASGALTLKLNPTNIDYRSATLTNGVPTNVVNAAQVTTTISSGSTAGTTSGTESSLLILAINNSGTTELAWTNALNPSTFNEQGLITTVAEGGAGGADSSSVVYSTTARTNVPYRVIGLFKSTQTTAGTWAQSPTLIHPVGGIPFVSSATTLEIDKNSPTFSAIRSSTQSISSATFTKVQCNVEEFDLTNSYDNSSLYRFSPSVAGVYSVTLRIGTASSSNCTRCFVSIYKNGADYRRGSDTQGAAINAYGAIVSSLIYLNGTTDYLEGYAYLDATSAIIDGGGTTYFQASLVRAG